MKDIFESHSVKTLKSEISKYNKLTLVSGYSKMKKSDLVDLMLKHKDKFKHIKMNPKPLKALPKALKKEAPKKEAPKKEAPKKASPKIKFVRIDEIALPSKYRKLFSNILGGGLMSVSVNVDKNKKVVSVELSKNSKFVKGISKNELDEIIKKKYGDIKILRVDKNIKKPKSEKEIKVLEEKKFTKSISLTRDDLKKFSVVKAKELEENLKKNVSDKMLEELHNKIQDAVKFYNFQTTVAGGDFYGKMIKENSFGRFKEFRNILKKIGQSIEGKINVKKIDFSIEKINEALKFQKKMFDKQKSGQDVIRGKLPEPKEAPKKEGKKEILIVFGREFERRPVVNNTVNLKGLKFKNLQEEKEYKRVIEGGKPKTKEQAPPQLKKIYKDIEEEEKEAKVSSIIKNWNRDVNNLELEQSNKRLTKTIKGLVNSKKKDINLDSILTFDLDLTKELIERYKFQKVLDGYKKFVEYLDDEGDKNIGKDKVNDYYFMRDGRIMPNAMMKKLPQKLQKKILEEWKKASK